MAAESGVVFPSPMTTSRCAPGSGWCYRKWFVLARVTSGSLSPENPANYYNNLSGDYSGSEGSNCRFRFKTFKNIFNGIKCNLRPKKLNVEDDWRSLLYYNRVFKTGNLALGHNKSKERRKKGRKEGNKNCKNTKKKEGTEKRRKERWIEKTKVEKQTGRKERTK